MPRSPRRVTVSNWDRLPANQRAGTHIDHANAQAVFATVRAKVQKFGIIDHRQRVFQCGGELSNFVFWKLRLVSLPEEVWRFVEGKVDYIEVIDHVRNRYYRLSADTFREFHQRYNEHIGWRVGVHLDHWAVTGGPVEPERPEPAPSPSAPTS